MDYGKINPDEDGDTHINIYTKGKTELGRMLSNLSNIGFTHPTYGEFRSMEGWYYYVATGFKVEDLKHYYGFNAKALGNKFERVPNDDFERHIKCGLMLKILQNERLKEMVKESTLPFTHYYNYGGKIILPKGQLYQVEYIESFRQELKNG